MIGLGKQGWGAEHDEGRPHPRSHVSAWQNCPRAELVGGCDPAYNGVQPETWRIERDVFDMLGKQQWDIISLATPAETHRRLVEICAGQSRLIVCEKPFALNAHDARVMVTFCEATGTILLVNHGRRFHPLIRGVKQEIDGGRIGKPVWASAWTSGGLWDNQIHMIDLLRFFMGDVGWVYATWKRPCGERGEDGYVMTLQFTSGAYAVIHAGDIRRYVQSEMHLFGEAGGLWLRQYGLGAIWYEVDDHYPLAGGYQRLVLADASDVASPTTFLAEMTEHACDVLEGKAEPWCTGEDGLKAIQVCEAAERSLAAGSMPIVPGAS